MKIEQGSLLLQIPALFSAATLLADYILGIQMRWKLYVAKACPLFIRTSKFLMKLKMFYFVLIFHQTF